MMGSKNVNDNQITTRDSCKCYFFEWLQKSFRWFHDDRNL